MERARKEMKDTKEKSKKTKESIEKMGKGATVAGAAMVGGFVAVAYRRLISNSRCQR
ncbi:hypothetical protein P7H06_25525 [Paenibacillus larvae]|nr:hypothetical protein [Paenibacillus larvae]MDT2262178.1 hypothetical protein [Paenibacillus larvae]